MSGAGEEWVGGGGGGEEWGGGENDLALAGRGWGQRRQGAGGATGRSGAGAWGYAVIPLAPRVEGTVIRRDPATWTVEIHTDDGSEIRLVLDERQWLWFAALPEHARVTVQASSLTAGAP